MKTCENCGSKVFSAGCVNCDEDNYIEIQRHENNKYDNCHCLTCKRYFQPDFLSDSGNCIYCLTLIINK